ncbi:MAG: AbrB/MazE/SpoVT family DNA-binding domain-containing protein [Candidatus Levyibacteriota bacterium]
MKQKVIKVGNSLAITLPSAFVKDRGIKAGQEVYISLDAHMDMLFLRTTKKGIAAITPEFKQWLEAFIENHADVLKDLAKK